MARRPRDARLENRTNRLKLPIRINAYGYVALAPGVGLGYCRRKAGGRWQIRVADGHGSYWFRVIGLADDHLDADGESTLDWFQAQAKALAIARGKDDARGNAPATVATALDDYRADLVAHGRDPANADRPRPFLTPSLLSKPVMLLTTLELTRWRNRLIEDGRNPATLSRTFKALAAALSLAARNDPQRISNASAWRIALAKLPDNLPREFDVSDKTVLALVTAAYRLDASFGLVIEVAAQTGGRFSQLARIRIADLHAAGADSKLGIPPSRKGHRRKRGKHVMVPITAALAGKLKAAAGTRPAGDPLLVKADGSPWEPRKTVHRAMFATIAAQAGLAGQGMYLLRHASVCRQILKGVPLKLIADSHDTSTLMIEAAYSWFINRLKQADELTRAALLDTATAAPPAGTVIKLRRER